MDIMGYIKPELLILVPVLYLLGLMLKNTAKVKDKFIPILLGIAGIVLATLYVLATADIKTYKDVIIAIFTAITQGILCAGCSVYVNQSFKQIKKNE